MYAFMICARTLSFSVFVNASTGGAALNTAYAELASTMILNAIMAYFIVESRDSLEYTKKILSTMVHNELVNADIVVEDIVLGIGVTSYYYTTRIEIFSKTECMHAV
jgi:hypothetical protein